MNTKTKPTRPGRPPGSGQNFTAAIPRTRVQTETRDRYFALGGADWLRQAIDRDYAALQQRTPKK